jgi:hypothetical protein
MKEYKIARARNLILLEEYVNKFLVDGYEPIGTITVNPSATTADDFFSQALIKEL